MANALANLARVFTSSTGTGDIVLGNPVPGYVSFTQGGINDTDVLSYGIAVYADNGTVLASEVGSATYDLATNSLTGRTPVTSTNSNNAISLPAGAQIHVFVTATASDIGGAGTVTSFSAGDLSPVFTTNVANPTTTPALTFALTNAGASTWFGNNTGGSAAPAYNSAGALTKVDDTNVTITLGGSPTAALLNSTSLTMGWTGTLAASRGGTGVSSLGDITRVDDTNVTLTLGGTPTGAVINSTSFTMGWTGQLAVPRGGTGLASATAYAVLCGGATSTGAFQSIASVGTSGQVLTSNGAGALPSFQAVPTAPSITVGTTNVAGGNTTRVLYDNAGVLGEYVISGTGNVAMTTSPVFTTPNLGTPSALVLTNATGTPTSIGLANGTGLPVSTGISGLGTGVATMLASNTAPTLALAFVIDGGGSTITTGNKRGIYIPFACTITGWNIGLDQSGSIVIDIWKDTEANYPPTVADTITAAAKPTVTTATHNASTTLTGWTTTIAAGNWLFFNVDSVTSATWANITLTVTKT